MRFLRVLRVLRGLIIAMEGEFEFIERIRNQAARTAPDLILGIGDDAAILQERTGRETLVTVDLLVEDIDFKLEYAPPRLLGHRALAVSLSDIAAMGGRPKFSLMTLAIPKRNLKSQISNLKSEIFWSEFFAGYFALAEQHGVNLIGGDISSTPERLTIDSIVIGHCESGKAVRRSGAKAGDGIFLTGSIGASATGLKLLLGGARINESENSLLQDALRAHLKPEPRVTFGSKLGELGLAHAMVDVSDGLAQDLEHICRESRTAAILDFDSAPIAQVVDLITKDREENFLFAVNGGEDFELMLTANSDSTDRLMDLAESCEIRLTRIGEIIESNDNSSLVMLRHKDDVTPLAARGYDHFLI